MKLTDIEECTNSYTIGIPAIDIERTEESDIRLAWERTIASKGPFSYFFTLSFVRRYSDAVAIDAAKEWVKLVNKRVSGSRWRQDGSGLSGIVVAERHKESLEMQGVLHFHFLIRNTDICPDRLQDFAEANALRLRDGNRDLMSDTGRIAFVLTDSEPGLIAYLTKAFQGLGSNPADYIAFLNCDSGLDDFCFTKSGQRW